MPNRKLLGGVRQERADIDKASRHDSVEEPTRRRGGVRRERREIVQAARGSGDPPDAPPDLAFESDADDDDADTAADEFR